MLVGKDSYIHTYIYTDELRRQERDVKKMRRKGGMLLENPSICSFSHTHAHTDTHQSHRDKGKTIKKQGIKDVRTDKAETNTNESSTRQKLTKMKIKRRQVNI